MRYKYIINANGISGTRESTNGIYEMLLLPDDTQSASASGPPPASTAPPPRSAYVPPSTPPASSAYVYAPPSTPPPRSAYVPPSTPPPLPPLPSVIPEKLSNLLTIREYYKENGILSHKVLSVTHKILKSLKVNYEINIEGVLFYKVNNLQINMKYNNDTYPLLPTHNQETWNYIYTYREVEL
jgi:hypothetical protein